ncbi:MAG: NrtA/SsuA/CpmA family ABC transporter substrate-binding protein [Peptostreptococcaceae bacterium]|nr:NrtA/SsuA/CpmA family ABC transporter substrate-binding protein [Peptostreptococcaceae bacterium]
MKKISLFIALLIMVMTVMSGCASGAGDVAEVPQKEKVNISYVKLPLNVPSIIEKNKMLFEDTFVGKNIEVAFPEITQGSKMTEALASGSLDFCNALGGTSAILAAANGVDVKIIGIYSRAPKAFTIMAKDDSIVGINDLRGKKIVGPKGTILHQLLLAALVENGMTMDDVEFINMGIGDGMAALSSGNADAVLVAGPAVTIAIEDGNRVIETGEGLLDATIVIATSGNMIENYPEIVDTYMDVHSKSLEYMKNNPEDTFAITAEETNIDVEAVKTMYAWYDFNPQISDKDIDDLIKTQEFLIENGMLENEIDINDIIVDTFVK